MTDPIVFISRSKVKEGKADDFRSHYGNSIPPIEVGRPGTLLQLAYESEDATEVTIVRLFPNAEALDLQLQGADERSKKRTSSLFWSPLRSMARPAPLL